MQCLEKRFFFEFFNWPDHWWWSHSYGPHNTKNTRYTISKKQTYPNFPENPFLVSKYIKGSVWIDPLPPIFLLLKVFWTHLGPKVAKKILFFKKKKNFACPHRKYCFSGCDLVVVPQKPKSYLLFFYFKKTNISTNSEYSKYAIKKIKI